MHQDVPAGDARLIEQLLAHGTAVSEGFLAAPCVSALIECARQRLAQGGFSPARVGGGRTAQRREEIRGDHTCWLAEPLFPVERDLLGKLEKVRLGINREACLGLFDLEMHYAWYPPGTGYARHVDRPQGREHRCVSLALYLNETWLRGAGGELRIFAAGGARDIEPIAGRLVCFLTAGREHAVLPTREPRLSIAGWFRQRA